MNPDEGLDFAHEEIKRLEEELGRERIKKALLSELLYLVVKVFGEDNVLPIVGAANVEVAVKNEFSWEVAGDDLILKLEEFEDDNRDQPNP
jgi:hypothetical protein